MFNFSTTKSISQQKSVPFCSLVVGETFVVEAGVIDNKINFDSFYVYMKCSGTSAIQLNPSDGYSPEFETLDLDLKVFRVSIKVESVSIIN